MSERPNRLSAKRSAEFTEAFNAEIAEHPGVPPGPTALSRRLGLGGKGGRLDNLNGRYSKLRTSLLEAAGFRKDTARNRWVTN